MQLKRRGWFQREIAEALGVSEVTISRWLARARMSGLMHSLLIPAPVIRRNSLPDSGV